MAIKVLRFPDLKEAGIVDSWSQLKRLQEHEGFPIGCMLGPRTRVWQEQEIEDWFASRPTAGPPPRGNAKARHEARKRKIEQHQSAEA
jgi:predicted DNA-binding transcriptional regulator AlpA